MASPKYTLSNEIMGLEARLGLTQKEAAKYLGISIEELLSMENVDLPISKEKYKLVIDKLLEKLWSNISISYKAVNESIESKKKQLKRDKYKIIKV